MATPAQNGAMAVDWVALTEIEAKVMDLRLRGRSLRAIEKELGITHAYRVWKRALMRTENAPYLRAEAVRVEAARLDAIQDGIWDKATTGDSRAVEVCLKILERRARLFGLDFDHLLAERRVDIEQAKTRMMAEAMNRVFDSIGLTGPQREAAVRLLTAEMRAMEAVVELD